MNVSFSIEGASAADYEGEIANEHLLVLKTTFKTGGAEYSDEVFWFRRFPAYPW